MKYLVETLGAYALHDLFGRQTIEATRPTVVRPSPFVETQKGRKLKILAVLADEADDAPLAKAKTTAELEAAIKALPLPAGSTEAETLKPATRAVPKLTPKK